MGFRQSLSLGGITLAAALGGIVSAADGPAKSPWLPASPQALPRWRGFNLLEKFQQSGNRPFLEEDFRLISALGFNFVRLPMDYRTWIVDGDWNRFDERVLKEIDQAVAWGGQYGIHVCLNFHRAPGYTVAKPPEATDLWTDGETQRICARHWAAFARRYKGIPSERLSFNLMNEPSRIDGETYLRVARILVEAIRAEDPERLVVADGLNWATKPCLELRELGIAQATRGYTPFHLTHYKATWVGNTDWMPSPAWPRPLAYGVVYGASKPELQAPLVIEGPFPKASVLRLHVAVVSSRALLLVRADGREVFRHDFVCGPGEGEWKEAVFKEEWDLYQNLYDRDYTAEIPAGTRTLTVEMTEGDWLQIRSIGVTLAGEPERVLEASVEWGRKPTPLRFDPGNRENAFSTEQAENREWLWQTAVEPWRAAQEAGIGVMVGEWGCFNKTPHSVVLAWAEDCLRNWQRAGWGWAMWNFRGSFGVLDSGRPDVEYEDFEGHKLDRELLELLLRY
ncbi:MAG: cellulase family glycosylhydrolase [Lentisphaeria bacterium]|nr:cellulase family glycosylhydrolase [Lentisphaeria bacterium]